MVFNREPLKAPLDQTSPNYANAAGRVQRAGRGVQGDRHALRDQPRQWRLQRQGPAGRHGDQPVVHGREGDGPERRLAGPRLADVGSQAMLNPANLQPQAAERDRRGLEPVQQPVRGPGAELRQLRRRPEPLARANEYTMVQTMIADRMMSELSCNIVMTDFNKPTTNRLLFAGVTLTDTPATPTGDAAIQQTIKNLHKSLLEGRPRGDRRRSPAHGGSVQGGLGRPRHGADASDELLPTTTPTTRTTRVARGLPSSAT